MERRELIKLVTLATGAALAVPLSGSLLTACKKVVHVEDSSYTTQFFNKEDFSLKKEDPSLRHTVKTMALGCGYGVGAKRFSEFSGTTEKEAAKSVALYRSSLPKVTRYWRDLNDSLNVAYDSECPFERQLRV